MMRLKQLFRLDEQNTWLQIFRAWELIRLLIWIFNKPLVHLFTLGRNIGPLEGQNFLLAIVSEFIIVFLSFSPRLQKKWVADIPMFW